MDIETSPPSLGSSLDRLWRRPLERGTTEPFGGHLFLLLVRLATISIAVLTDYIDQLRP